MQPYQINYLFFGNTEVTGQLNGKTLEFKRRFAVWPSFSSWVMSLVGFKAFQRPFYRSQWLRGAPQGGVQGYHSPDLSRGEKRSERQWLNPPSILVRQGLYYCNGNDGSVSGFTFIRGFAANSKGNPDLCG
jgi:hypothetical protein